MEAAANRLGVTLPEKEPRPGYFEQVKQNAIDQLPQLLADINQSKNPRELSPEHRVAGHLYLEHIDKNVLPELDRRFEAETDPVKKQDIGNEIKATLDRYGDVASKVYRAGSEAGRGLGLQRLFAKAPINAAKLIEKATSLAGRDLSPTTKRFITEKSLQANRVQDRINGQIDTAANNALREVSTRKKPVPKVFTEDVFNESRRRLSSVDFAKMRNELDGSNC
jgi:hypothetical protein